MKCTYCDEENSNLERVHTCIECFKLYQKQRDIRITLNHMRIKLNQLEELEKQIDNRTKKIYKKVKTLGTAVSSGKNYSLVRRYSDGEIKYNSE